MNSAKQTNEYRFSGYRLDVGQRKLYGVEGQEVSLSSRAFDTLLVLIENRGETLEKAELMKVVWPKVVVEENNLNQAISSLRKALGDSKSESRFIHTVPGRGYRFVAQLETLEEDKVLTDTDTPLNRNSGEAAYGSQQGNKSKNNFKLFFALVFCLVAVAIVFYMNNSNKNLDIEIQGALALNSLEDKNSPEINIIPDSIAVIPFTNLNETSESELFSLGLHDEVISQLSKINSLKVISRDSVVAISNQYESINDLGRRLQVESIMTGTVLLVEGRARVNLQMLEPETGITLWASNYDADTGNLSDMISIQSDIALNAALALQAEIGQQEQLAVEAMPTESFEAYRYLLAAKNAYYAQDFEKTWTLSKQAFELDSDYIDAHYLFSYVNTVLTAIPLTGMSSSQHFQLALDSAEAIISLAPENSQGYSLKASALGTNKEWGKVTDEVERLKQMGVPLADMKFYALTLLCLGDFKGAIEVIEANLFIEPVNLYGRGFLLSAYELAGNREQSRQEFALGDELNPIWWGDTVNVFLTLGRNEPLLDVDELFEISDGLRSMLSNLDNQALVKASLQDYYGRDDKISAETVYYSGVAAYIGDPELAMEFMRDALDDVWLNFHWLWLPVFDEARQLESFKQLLIDSGIVDYWKEYGWQEVCQPEMDTFSCNWQAYP